MSHHRCIADLPDAPHQWLWPGRIPRGALTLLVGDPGRGKSLLTLDMAARTSAGLPWPDGAAPADPGNVLLLSAEDSLMRTVRTRLVALGADLARIHYLNAGHWSGPDPVPLTKESYATVLRPTPFGYIPRYLHDAIRRDAQHLKEAVESLPDCRLVVIDPIPAYLHDALDGDSADASPALATLATLADVTGTAIVAVAHRDQVIGARDKRRQAPLRTLAAMARAIYLVDRLPDAARASVLVAVKNNFGPLPAPLLYHVTSTAAGAPAIAWSPAPPGFAYERLGANAAAHPERRLTETERATLWLQGALAAGPVPSRELMQRARAAGFSHSTLKRARARLGVHASHSLEIGGPWICAVPDKKLPESREDQISDLSHSDLSPILQLPSTNDPEEPPALNDVA